MTEAVSLVLVITGMGLFFGFLLAFANKKLALKSNPLIDVVEEELPKGQCGGCGFAGCRQYAEAVVMRPDVSPCLCAPGGKEVSQIIASLTGKAALDVTPMKAMLMCTGSRGEDSAIKHLYEGITDCAAAAMMYTGDKVCEFGCLGYGNCVRACPYQALTLSERNLPVVDAERCTGCGVCVETCPRHVMALVPATAQAIIKCRNPAKAGVIRNVCKVGCLKCGLCIRTCPHEAITMVNGVPKADYGKCAQCKEPVCLVVKCVPKSIQPFYGVKVPNIAPPKPRPVKKASEESGQ